MDLKISKKLESKIERKRSVLKLSRKGIFDTLKGGIKSKGNDSFNPAWNAVLLLALFLFLFGFLIFQLVSLQVVQGEHFLAKSKRNQVSIREEKALRGVIMDRNGKLLVKNVASMNVYISIERYIDENGYIDTERLETTLNTLGGIIGDLWKSAEQAEEFTTLSEKIYSTYEKNTYFTEILVARNINDDMAIKIKASTNDLPGVYIDSGSKREYVHGDAFAHILGYTGNVTAEDLKKLDYVKLTDVVGRTGLEKQYDEYLLGEDGEIAWEVDSFGRKINEEGYVVKEPVAGKNLYLALDVDIQKKLYELMEKAVIDYGAVGGAAIIEDVNNGELLALVSNPGYDNNLFVGGISQKEYDKLLKNPRNPLLNRAIAAQVPPGSTFKILVAAGGLDAGVLTRNTIYVSRAGYTFTVGASFQEYGNRSHGPLNLIDAISVSSNKYFCEMIRKWDMNGLVPYLEKFGVGEYWKVYPVTNP